MSLRPCPSKVRAKLSVDLVCGGLLWLKLAGRATYLSQVLNTQLAKLPRPQRRWSSIAARAPRPHPRLAKPCAVAHGAPEASGYAIWRVDCANNRSQPLFSHQGASGRAWGELSPRFLRVITVLALSAKGPCGGLPRPGHGRLSVTSGVSTTTWKLPWGVPWCTTLHTRARLAHLLGALP